MRVRALLVTALLATLTIAPASAAVSPQDVTPRAGAPSGDRVKPAELARQLRAQGGTTKTETVTRTVLDNGQSAVVDQRRVSVTVGSLNGVRDRQGLRVAWKGAHPTGGVVADQNSGTAATQQEYPFVIMQCRGVDSAKAPAAKQLTPESCWTQTPFERFSNDFNSQLPAWRLDRYAALRDRKQYVGGPKRRPAQCFSPAEAERWVPFVTGAGKTYYGGPNGCAGLAPEATSNLSTLALPGNTTYATTARSGSGSAVFNVRTSATNASLGCSERIDCALVVIPIMGISCDADATMLPAVQLPSAGEVTAAGNRCRQTGVYPPGANNNPSVQPDASVTGAYWWSASNWRNRLVFPMKLAPTNDSCDITQGGGVSVFGSELMIQATDQWSPTFCLDPKRTPVNHVQTGEPQARSLLKSQNIEAAMVSRPPDPPGYGRPVVHAPVAVTGFAVTFQVDGGNGRALPTLLLTPRLLAKLLTQSYPAVTAVRRSYTALSQNPMNITDDPEFQALNPGAKSDVGSPSAATLLALSSDSDVIWALTSYIDSDPEARAWLDGKADPWGMMVNPNYKGIELPVQTWPVLDTFEPTDIYQPGVNDCLFQNPVPYLPLVAAPQTRLSYIALAMQFAIAPSQLVCTLPSLTPGSTEGAKLVALGRQVPGYRFMIGITGLADARRYEIPQASLLSGVSKNAQDQFTSDQGRTFVEPSERALVNAAALLRPEPGSTHWDLPYGVFHSAAGGSKAYPGTMVVYADIPTEGLEAADAKAYASWLQFVATEGQTPGEGVGNLPPGYVPMTKANGLGALSDYTQRAAAAVLRQDGQVPPLTAETPSGDPAPNNGPSGGTTTTGGGTTTTGGGTTTTGDTSSGGSAPSPQDSSSPVAASLGETSGDSAGVAGLVLPAVLLLAMVAGIAASATLFRSKLRASK